MYDGSTDPMQHMHRFATSMYVYNALDIAYCQIFPSSLAGQALAWYSHLLARSISSFQDLGEKLTKHFLAHAIFTPTSDFLLSIRQKIA